MSVNHNQVQHKLATYSYSYCFLCQCIHQWMGKLDIFFKNFRWILAICCNRQVRHEANQHHLLLCLMYTFSTFILCYDRSNYLYYIVCYVWMSVSSWVTALISCSHTQHHKNWWNVGKTNCYLNNSNVVFTFYIKIWYWSSMIYVT